MGYISFDLTGKSKMAAPKVLAKNPLALYDSLRMRKRRKLISQDEDFDATMSDASSFNKDKEDEKEDASCFILFFP